MGAKIVTWPNEAIGKVWEKEFSDESEAIDFICEHQPRGIWEVAFEGARWRVQSSGARLKEKEEANAAQEGKKQEDDQC